MQDVTKKQQGEIENVAQVLPTLLGLVVQNEINESWEVTEKGEGSACTAMLDSLYPPCSSNGEPIEAPRSAP